MAFAVYPGFLSAIATNPADTAAGRLTPARYNLAHAPSGADVGGLVVCPTATSWATYANLTYAETSGPRLQVGSGNGTSNGWILGYFGLSGLCGMWSTALTPTTSNYAVAQDSTGTTYFNSAGSLLNFRFGATTKATFSSTAGSGFSITAGTATTDVQALSATQTWNAAGVAFTGWKFTITDTASAAGSLAMQILGGAAGATSLFKVTKGGQVDAPSYAVNGTAGADFGPGAVTSITVVKGIVTAIS